METQIENRTKTPNQVETTERKENNTENTNDKCQADVLNQARLQPHGTSLRPKIVNCLIKIASSRSSYSTARLANYRLLYPKELCDLDSPEEIL
jgi:hypothetical protein